MTRYIVEPHNHGYQIIDTRDGSFCHAAWTTLEPTAQHWAAVLNDRYNTFMEHSRFAVKRINRECEI